MILDEVVTKQNKLLGTGTMFSGNDLRYHPPRLPTGVFPVDLISAGGSPMHGSTCFWGGETGAKTYLAIKSMKVANMICWNCFNVLSFCTCSEKALKMRSSWIDIEGTLEKEWVDTCGVDPKSYIVTLADCAEHGIDCADASLQADDCGLVIIDSLGALTPQKEMERSAEDPNVGFQPSLVTKAVKKLKQRMIRERKRGHNCCVIFINQMRKKYGVNYGSNEIQSGGHAMMHEFSLLFKCGKRSMGGEKNTKKYEKYQDSKRGRCMASLHSAAIYKEKVFIFAREAEFVIVKEDIDLFKLHAGDVDDSKYAVEKAREFGTIEQVKGGYKLLGITDTKYKTLKDLQLFLFRADNEYLQLKKNTIDVIIKDIKGKEKVRKIKILEKA